VKLISEAQEASSEITDVLTTAAQASENQDDIERNRISQTRMQVAIIVMTYVTLLGVMAILQTQFIDVMGDLSSQADGGGASGGGGAGLRRWWRRRPRCPLDAVLPRRDAAGGPPGLSAATSGTPTSSPASSSPWS